MARILSVGFEFLAQYEVLWIIQVTGPAAQEFLEVVNLLDAKVQEFTKCNPIAYQMEIRAQAGTVVFEYEEAVQWQRAAKEQQAAADRHEDEQMGRVTHAAHENQPPAGCCKEPAQRCSAAVHEHSQRPH
jgi:hypothetical protein